MPLLTPAELDLDGDARRQKAQRPRDDDFPAEYPEGDDLAPEEYAKYSRALWDEQESGLEQLHRTWTQNLLFLAGFQWWRYDKLTGTFRPEAVPKYRERPATNLLVPFFKHFLAKVTKNRPAFKSIPASTDPEDVAAANTADDALRAKWQELRISRVIRRAIAWCIPTGNGWVLPFWNEETGKLFPLTVPVEAAEFDAESGAPTGNVRVVDCPCDEQGQPMMTEDGRYDLDAEPIWRDEGDVAARSLSPYQVRTDPSAETPEDSTFYLIGEVRLNRDLRRKWPHLNLAHSADLGLMERYDAMVTGLGVSGGRAGADTHMVGGAADRDDEIPKSLVIWHYEKQSEEYPQGRHWVSIGNELAEDPDDLPDGLWPPALHMKELEVPGRFHGGSTFEAAVGLQREYNEVNALIKEHHNLMLRGKWLVPIGSNIRRGQITQQPGEVIQHTPGLAPQMAKLVALPAAVYQERERILADFERITGIRAVSMGEAPPGVTSGRAFLTLQEADDTDLGPFLEMLEETVAALAKAFLQMMQIRYDDERLIYIVGQDRQYQVRHFKGADLIGVLDIVPQAGSSHPWSSVAKQNMLLEIVETSVGQELFTDPQTGQFDRRRFAQMMPVAGLDSVYEHEDLDYNEARREEEKFELFDGNIPEEEIAAALEAGQEPPPPDLPRVLPWQNHTAHLETHERVLKAESFKNWHPTAQEAFINHWRETKAAVDEMLMKQLMMQAQAQMSAAAPPGGGGGGGRGGPSKAAGSGNHPNEKPEKTDSERAAGGG